MILVDIYVPALDDSFQFELEEQIPIQDILSQIIQILTVKTKNSLREGDAPFLLCNPKKQEILSKEKSLRECGIEDGTRLLLV